MLAINYYYPIVVEQGGKTMGETFNLIKGITGCYSPCFIFGPEDTGFGPDWPAHISLEQVGVSRSYNVSSAASIVLYSYSFR